MVRTTGNPEVAEAIGVYPVEPTRALVGAEEIKLMVCLR